MVIQQTTRFLLPQLFLKRKLGAAHLLEKKYDNEIVTDEQKCYIHAKWSC